MDDDRYSYADLLRSLNFYAIRPDGGLYAPMETFVPQYIQLDLDTLVISDIYGYGKLVAYTDNRCALFESGVFQCVKSVSTYRIIGPYMPLPVCEDPASTRVCDCLTPDPDPTPYTTSTTKGCRVTIDGSPRCFFEGDRDPRRNYTDVRQSCVFCQRNASATDFFGTYPGTCFIDGVCYAEGELRTLSNGQEFPW